LSVKFDPYAYLDAASAALDLAIPPERREVVAANLARLHALAQEVIEPASTPESPGDSPA
jgi:hypothetical protein